MPDIAIPLNDGLIVANGGQRLLDTDDLVDEYLADLMPAPARKFAGLRSRPDRGFIVGRFAGADFYNTNGNYFPYEDLNVDRHGIPHIPLDVSHQSTFIVGHYLTQQMVHQDGTTSDARTPAYTGGPYVETSMVAYRRIHPKVWAATKDAFDAGMVFQSQQCIPGNMDCGTDGCPCGGKNYAYDGLTSATYCDALNQPRARKRLHRNTFTAGALVIPPSRPGWNRADLTMVAGLIEAHSDVAEDVYYQLAAELDHLEPADWEWMMSALLAHAAGDELPPRPVRSPGFTADLTTRGDGPVPAVVAAGLAVRATDTGRVLMLQRSLHDETDPARGTWEFPGGRLEENETPLEAAMREWCEEVGCALPAGDIGNSWATPQPGSYVGTVYHVKTEDVVPINLPNEQRQVADPDGDYVETVAWFTPEQARELGQNLRAELRVTSNLWLHVLEQGPDFRLPADARSKFEELPGVAEVAARAALASGDAYLVAKAVAEAVDEIWDRSFTAEQRRKAAEEGAAMPDGTFPIYNRGDLQSAIRLAGHADDPTKAKAHIRKRARALGLTNMIPESWGS